MRKLIVLFFGLLATVGHAQFYNDAAVAADINASLPNNNNKQITAAVLRGLLSRTNTSIANNNITATGVLKTPKLSFGSQKGLEIWGTGGGVMGLSNDYVEASIKSRFVSTDQNIEFSGVGGFVNWIWKANNVERMRLTRDGNMLIGTLTDNGLGRLQLNGSIYTTGGIINGNLALGSPTTAAERLDIYGNVRVRNTLQIAATYKIGSGKDYGWAAEASNGHLQLYAGDGSTNLVNESSFAPINLKTNSTTRLSIKPTGAVNFTPLAAAPASPTNGDVYYDSTINKLRLYANGAWVNLNP